MIDYGDLPPEICNAANAVLAEARRTKKMITRTSDDVFVCAYPYMDGYAWAVRSGRIVARGHTRDAGGRQNTGMEAP